MCKIKNFLVITILTMISCKNTRGPIIKYNTNKIDLGEIEFKKEFHGKITIYNTGDEPLKFLEATADCSCTVPDDVKNTIIQPNDSGYLSFKITPAMDGFIQQSIYLNNTSTNENRVLFFIRANVKLL